MLERGAGLGKLGKGELVWKQFVFNSHVLATGSCLVPRLDVFDCLECDLTFAFQIHPTGLTLGLLNTCA